MARAAYSSSRSSRATQGGVPDVALPRVVLMLVVLALTLLGFVMIFSASSISAITEEADASSYLVDQLIFAVIGIGGAVIVWKLIPVRAWLGPLLWAFWGISIAMLVLTALMGTTALGAQRWLTLGPISLQPSEFAKTALILMAARLMYFFQMGQYDFRDLVINAVVLILLPVGLLYFSQSDLGTTAIIALGILGVMWFGKVPMRWILILVIGLGVFAFAAIFLVSYRTDRLLYLNPWDDGENGYGRGYQIIHSFYAFAEGGIFGVGLGNSREKYLYLPESETDFIYAIIGEELGLIGAVLVIAAFLILLWAGLRIARGSRDPFGTMVAGALTIMLVFQAFLNIGCAIGVFPTTGKPLPFISSGGSSLIASFLMIGIIMSVADEGRVREREQERAFDRNREQLRVVRHR